MRYKSKAKLIIIMSIILLIFITILVLFFNTDIFRTKRSAFFRYFEYIPTALDIIETNDFQTYKNSKNTNPYTRKSTMTIQSSSNIADNNILDKIKINAIEKNDAKNEKNNTEISINNGNTEMAKISYVKEKNISGLYCPLISNGYICLRNENLKNIATSVGLDEKYIPNEIKNINISKIFEISKSEKTHIMSIIKLLRDNSPDTAYTKQTNKKIKIDDVSYSTTAYTLTLDEKENSNMQIDLLQKISQDSIMMNFITSKAKLLNLNDEYTNINTLNELMKKKIEELKSNQSRIEKIEITIYEYKQKNIKTEIKSGSNTIIIEHIKDDKSESSKIKINNTSIQIRKNGQEYYVKLINDTEEEKSAEITYSQLGTIENNNIENKMIIKLSSGIKNICYEYNDQVTFSSDIGNIQGFTNIQTAILNDYESSNVSEFVNMLKRKINSVYVSKGASIGINLDPIFIF